MEPAKANSRWAINKRKKGNMKSIAATQAGDFIEETAHSPTFQAYRILHWGFVAAPAIAGLDKFFMRLPDWTVYLWPPLGRLVGGAGTFMRIVGAIEIAAGCLVAFKPKLGAPIVAAWLLGIIVNLLLLGSFYDIALRDLGLCLGALALWRLATKFDDHTLPRDSQDKLRLLRSAAILAYPSRSTAVVPPWHLPVHWQHVLAAGVASSPATVPCADPTGDLFPERFVLVGGHVLFLSTPSPLPSVELWIPGRLCEPPPG